VISCTKNHGAYKKMTCNKFCQGPENTNRGINCKLNIIDKKAKVLKHNPKTKEAAINLIKNGGRWQICLQNPWRYEGL